MINKQYFFNRIIGIIVLLTAYSITATSQKRYDYLTSEFNISNNVSLNSAIFSTSIFDNKIKFSNVGINYNNQSGEYHRVQTGEKISNYGFTSNGSYIGKRIFMSGSFKFSQQSNKGVRFTSLLNPYRGTPYDLADSSYSNWKSQNYYAVGKLAYELVPNLLSFGVEVATSVARGAKQVDPRPKTNNSNIEFLPSLSLSTGAHLFSIGGGYSLFKENVDLILYNSSESQKIYELKGLGQYTYDIFSSTNRERNYNGSGLNALASYRYRKGALTLYLEGKYNNYTEEALDIEQSKLRLIGRLYNSESNLRFEGQYKGGKSLNIIKLHYNSKKLSGREIIEVYNPSETVNNWVTESEIPQRWQYSDKTYGAEYLYSLLSNSSQYAPLTILASADYKSIKESYRVMSTYREYDALYLQIAPTYNINWNSKFFTSFKLSYGLNKISNFIANYIGREESDQTINEIYFNHDAYIMQQNYNKMGVGINFGYNLKGVGAFVLSTNYQHLKANNNLFRNYFISSISYNF